MLHDFSLPVHIGKIQHASITASTCEHGEIVFAHAISVLAADPVGHQRL